MLLFNFTAFTSPFACYDFNTSNVTIQRYNRKIRFHYAEISIHLMLLFNIQNKAWNRVLDRFQYI